MKSARTPAIKNQLLRDMEPREIFLRLAQLQPHHKWVWKRSFRHWHMKKVAASTATV